MGWWGHGVMDGDTPADIEIALIESLNLHTGIEFDSDGDPVDENVDFAHFVKLNLQKVTDAQIIAAVEETAPEFIHASEDIIHQVLAHLYLGAGIPIPQMVKDQAIEESNGQIEDADSFNEPELRIAAMNDFIAAVNADDVNLINT